MSKLTAVRGMNDLLPAVTPQWQHVESVLRDLLRCHGYAEIRLPVVEPTPLFHRAIGAVTDIVEKEMYSFEDRSGESLTLRPEGTAGCVRAVLEHGLSHNQTQRLWYAGPMFRYERPQKGRYRQFHQLGVETFGFTGPDMDAELILMTARLWRALGVQDQVRLELNSLGEAEGRVAFRTALVTYLEGFRTQLDEDSQRRLTSNPLRILDSKEASTQAILAGAPRLSDYWDEGSQAHFDALCALLTACGVSYTVNPRLVRGLDYYNKTVFEWVTDALGAQGTVCAGGRYDGLVAQLGGRDTPAVGFAIGLERLLLLIEACAPLTPPAAADVFLMALDENLRAPALQLAEQLRTQLPGVAVVFHAGGGSVKSQFRHADKSGAQLACVLGPDEWARGEIALKWLRDSRQAQQTLPVSAVVTAVQAALIKE